MCNATHNTAHNIAHTTTQNVKPKIYIAGPMSGYDLYNFPLFDHVAAYCRRLGYIVISPADIDRAHGFDPTNGDTLSSDDMPRMARACIVRDMAAICDGCTHIVLLPGWENSFGACAEKAIADYLGLTVLEWQDVTHMEEYIR